MSTVEQDFITNTLRVCQDIQNRFYSERIKVGDVDPEERGGYPRFRSLLKMPKCFSRTGRLIAVNFALKSRAKL